MNAVGGIPREGTMSRQVCDLTLQGHSLKQIIAITAKPYATVRAMQEQFMSAPVEHKQELITPPRSPDKLSEGFRRLAEASRRYQQAH
jgi:hypothetical protein